MINTIKNAHRLFKALLLTFVINIVNIETAISQNVRTYIPPKAYPLVPIFKEELIGYFDTIPIPWYPLALAEHESCVTLKSPRCMSATSSFITKWPETGIRREQGVGISMITRAWTRDGTLRMDTLANLKKLYPEPLKDLNWNNIAKKPDLQIRAMVLLLKSDYNRLKEVTDPINRLYMTDAAYNGGVGDVLRARKSCGLAKNCDPNIWFGNVENYCVKSKKPLYGNRSACDINVNHVYDVIKIRMPKYEPLLPEL